MTTGWTLRDYKINNVMIVAQLTFLALVMTGTI